MRHSHLDSVVGVRTALKTLDLGRHGSSNDHSSWSLGIDSVTDGSVEFVQVLSIRLEHLQPVAL